MKISIICVGKAHDADLRASIADYESRLNRFTKVSWQFIPASDIDTESQKIHKASDGTYRVLLDERGDELSNSELLTKLEDWQNNAVQNVSFIIGGAFGVNEALRDQVDFTWSLSKLVFPHQLVRLILLEQLYRTYDTFGGGKYHHQ